MKSEPLLIRVLGLGRFLKTSNSLKLLSHLASKRRLSDSDDFTLRLQNLLGRANFRTIERTECRCPQNGIEVGASDVLGNARRQDLSNV
jgi:hypothetical protein